MITEEELAAAKGMDRVLLLRHAARQLLENPAHAYPSLAARCRARALRGAATRIERRLAQGPRPPTVEALTKFAERLDEKASEYANRLRAKVCRRIRDEVLLPFCRRHGLGYAGNPYGDRFIMPDGEVVDYVDIARYVDDPQAELMAGYLRIEFGRDRAFDDTVDYDIHPGSVHQPVEDDEA